MSKNEDIFDKVISSTPINRQASLSVSKGFEYSPNKKITVKEWDTVPALKKVIGGNLDLTGNKVGRLTVVGLLDAVKGQHGATWVCRCQCGKYTSRKAKAIQNPNNTDDRCEQCRHVKYLNTLGTKLSNNSYKRG